MCPIIWGLMYDSGEGMPEDDIRAKMALLEEKLTAEELTAARKLSDQLLKEMDPKKHSEEK